MRGRIAGPTARVNRRGQYTRAWRWVLAGRTQPRLLPRLGSTVMAKGLRPHRLQGRATSTASARPPPAGWPGRRLPGRHGKLVAQPIRIREQSHNLEASWLGASRVARGMRGGPPAPAVLASSTARRSPGIQASEAPRPQNLLRCCTPEAPTEEQSGAIESPKKVPQPCGTTLAGPVLYSPASCLPGAHQLLWGSPQAGY